MLDAFPPEKRQEWMIWLNQITAALKAISPGVDGHSPIVSMSEDQITVDGVAVGPHLTGPAGEDGSDGLQGAQGVQGDQGPAGADAIANRGEATIDFGPTPATEATVSVADTSVTASSRAWAFFMSSASTVDNDEDGHAQAAIFIRPVVSVSPGVGLDITAYCLVGEVTGTFKVEWGWM
jgi:hypothetical protein